MRFRIIYDKISEQYSAQYNERIFVFYLPIWYDFLGEDESGRTYIETFNTEKEAEDFIRKKKLNRGIRETVVVKNLK